MSHLTNRLNTIFQTEAAWLRTVWPNKSLNWNREESFEGEGERASYDVSMAVAQRHLAGFKQLSEFSRCQILTPSPDILLYNMTDTFQMLIREPRHLHGRER